MMRQLDAKIFCGLVFSDSTYTALHSYTQGFFLVRNSSHIDTNLKTLEMFRGQPDSSECMGKTFQAATTNT